MPDNRYALQVQSLGSIRDRVLVIADLLGRKSEDKRFKPSEIVAAMVDLNIPPPANVSQALAALRKSGQAMRHRDGRWALTPVGEVDAGALGISAEVEGADVPDGAQFAHTDHTIIPVWAAPPRWAAGIARLLERHPFESNVFCMTRFPSEGGIPDPVSDAIQTARNSLANFGLVLHVATDAIVDDDLLGNVGAYMWGCKYGLGIVEDRVGRGLNHNVVIELGGMMLTGRRCAILRDRTSPSLPTDLSGHIYKPVDLDSRATVVRATSEWARNDLGYGRN